MVGNPLDQEAYEWMERIQSHMGREQFEKVVEEHGFGGMPFIRRSGFEHFFMISEEQLQKIFQGQNVFLQIMMDQFQGEDK